MIDYTFAKLVLLRLLALIVRASVITLCAVAHNVNNDMDEVLLTKVCTIRTTRININRNNINPNDYYNSLIDYYNPLIDYYNLAIDYYNPVIDYYNPLLRFDPCLNQLG